MYWDITARKKALYKGVLVSLATAGILCLSFLIFSSQQKPVSAKAIISDSTQQHGFFSSERFDIEKVEGAKDPFSSHDYLARKLAHLVSFSEKALHPEFYQANLSTVVDNGISARTNFSYLLDDLIATVNVYNFFYYMWGCKQLKEMKIEDVLYDTKHKTVYRAIKDEYQVAVEVAKVDVDELISAQCGSADSDHSQQNLDRCFLIKYRRVLEEAVILSQFSHPNLVKVVGLCVQRPNAAVKHESKISSSSGVVLMKETGTVVNIDKLKLMTWNQKIQICFDLVSFANYLSRSPVGSVLLEGWAVENFILSPKSGTIKLRTFGRNIQVSDPLCVNNADCYVDGTDAGILCYKKRCKGYNDLKNLADLGQAFLLPLLQYGVPPANVASQARDIIGQLKVNSLSTKELLSRLEKLMPNIPGMNRNGANELLTQQEANNNPAILSMRKLPDGSQVDSWEQHEARVSINEVNARAGPALKAPAKEEVVEPLQPELPRKQDPLQNADSKPSPAEGYQKFDNADFPGRYDYYCPNSKAEWGCVMSLRSADEAMAKCTSDPKCKAFVTIPHLRKEGWIIAILKSDNSKPVDHAGTMVFVRPSENKGHQVLPPKDAEHEKVAASEAKDDCLSDVIVTQSQVRDAREALMMKSCGWAGMKDADWRKLIEESKVENANTFKPARGKLAVGGQMNVDLRVAGSNPRSALFLSKRGPEEFEVSQLAVHQLDRLLGLYKTVPAIERELSEAELSEAGFPVDIGGNQFDKFRPMKLVDNSLRGVVLPLVQERTTVVHYISVPRLSGITNAVTPFSRRQWDDMEYLLLGFLAAIPVPTKGHQSVQGRLMHIKTDDAFLERSGNDYISYLYNCQFPRHVINTLRQAVAKRCDLKRQIHTRLLVEGSPKIGELVERNVAKLLDLVDKCVTKFGSNMVLYDSSKK